LAVLRRPARQNRMAYKMGWDRFGDPVGYDANRDLTLFVGSVLRFLFFLVGLHQSLNDGEREAVDRQDAVLAAFLDR